MVNSLDKTAKTTMCDKNLPEKVNVQSCLLILPWGWDVLAGPVGEARNWRNGPWVTTFNKSQTWVGCCLEVLASPCPISRSPVRKKYIFDKQSAQATFMPSCLKVSMNTSIFSEGIWSGLREEPKDTRTAPSVAESMNFLRSPSRGLASFSCRPPTWEGFNFYLRIKTEFHWSDTSFWVTLPFQWFGKAHLTQEYISPQWH